MLEGRRRLHNMIRADVRHEYPMPPQDGGHIQRSKTIAGITRHDDEAMRHSLDATSNAQPGVRRRSPLLTFADLRVVLELMTFLPVAWFASFRTCRSLAAFAARGASRVGLLDATSMAERLRRSAPDIQIAADVSTIPIEIFAGQYLDSILVLRLNRPGGWLPPIETEGIENLESALARGHGVIGWIADFSSHAIINLIGMNQAGHPAVFAASPTHGFTSSRFGRLFLNPLRCRIEDRFGRRVVLADDFMIAAGRALRRELAANEPVGLTAGAWMGRKFADVPFAGGQLRLATGVVNLAIATGAIMLPIITLWDDERETYRLIFDRALELPSNRKKDQVIAEVLEDYVHRLQPYILKYPGQWRGWRHFMAD